MDVDVCMSIGLGFGRFWTG